MATYPIEQRNGHHYVIGLREEFGEHPDTLLLFRYSYPESETPDVDNPNSAHKMHKALYDLFQCHDGLKKGDIFQTEYGNFECQGFEVVPMFELPISASERPIHDD